MLKAMLKEQEEKPSQLKGSQQIWLLMKRELRKVEAASTVYKVSFFTPTVEKPRPKRSALDLRSSSKKSKGLR